VRGTHNKVGDAEKRTLLIFCIKQHRFHLTNMALAERSGVNIKIG
jgi:hypothetical protein